MHAHKNFLCLQPYVHNNKSELFSSIDLIEKWKVLK